MAKLSFESARGRLDVFGWREPDMHAAAQLAFTDLEHGARGIAQLDFEGRAAHFKRDTLRGRARWRHGLKSRLHLARVPRVAEYFNLCWLHERLFRTPLPLAAGVRWRAGWPDYQFLLTETVPAAVPFDEFARNATRAERDELCDELAHELARMHALRFVHHDLYPRNVLIAPRGELQRIVLLDAWAGGPPPNLRGAAYDLACFFVRGDETLAREESARFLTRYALERELQGRPVALDALHTAIRRERAGLLRRLRQRPHELRGLPPPSAAW